VDVQFLARQGGWISRKWAAYIWARNANDPPADHDWHEYRGTIQIPAGTEAIRIQGVSS